MLTARPLRSSERARKLDVDQLHQVMADRDAELAGLREAVLDRETDRARLLPVRMVRADPVHGSARVVVKSRGAPVMGVVPEVSRDHHRSD